MEHPTEAPDQTMPDAADADHPSSPHASPLTATVTYGPVTATVDKNGCIQSLRIELPGIPGSAIAASVLTAVQLAQAQMKPSDTNVNTHLNQ